MGGDDTHASQRSELWQRLDEPGRALAAFPQAVDALGLAAQVTTFTLSDFNRTFRVDANDGSDHAWGGHQFAMGAAVSGGSFYGTFPALAIGGPDQDGDEGQWKRRPRSTSMVPLACWFGVPVAEVGRSSRTSPRPPRRTSVPSSGAPAVRTGGGAVARYLASTHSAARWCATTAAPVHSRVMKFARMGPFPSLFGSDLVGDSQFCGIFSHSL